MSEFHARADAMIAREPAVQAEVREVTARPTTSGKFLVVNGEKLYLKGVTYGPFNPQERESEYGDERLVRSDFERMAERGINAVRTYTLPPAWLLDVALQCGLYVMVGIPWEQHVAFLDDADREASIEQRVREGVRACHAHPALLSIVIGNEIPSSIVRWYDRHRVERFLHRLYLAVKDEDPEALVTYVNYPSTEYLELPFLDFVSFNVYLEEQERLEAYLARLQNLAGSRPLVMAEVGLDSRRNGLEEQARVLTWQVRSVFDSGCCGVFVFSWTDEWHRGGADILNWDFGLTDRDRRAKPALAAVEDAFGRAPFDPWRSWPKISVVICTFNGRATIRETLSALLDVAYPDFEVIVVDDGSTDDTADIASEFDVRFIRTENRGLSSARNTGLEAADGEIVAYLDDDAYPDPHWLHYLATAFLDGKYAGVGGPNISPPDDGLVARSVDKSPGNATHVLFSDREAEHIPGCNMAFRKYVLEEVGGFDPQFRIAGDDVDMCWRLIACGHRIGFAPSAMVWHHRRATVSGYWKQQRNYGRAEALLEMKWPEKYNLAGHVSWGGRVYESGHPSLRALRPSRVYFGIWGTAPFQSLYDGTSRGVSWVFRLPEMYLLIGALGLASVGALSWPPLLVALLLAVAGMGLLLVRASMHAHATTPQAGRSRWKRLKEVGLVTFLHVVQPLARLMGRVREGLTPWRWTGKLRFVIPKPRKKRLWSETWRSTASWLEELESRLYSNGYKVIRGSEFDRWDLEVRCGPFGSARTLMVVEEHGGGRQMLRVRSTPRSLWATWIVIGVLLLLSAAAATDGGTLASTLLGLGALLAVGRVFLEWSSANGAVADAVHSMIDEHDSVAPVDGDRS